MKKYGKFIPTIVLTVFLIVACVLLVRHAQKPGSFVGINTAASENYIRPKKWKDISSAAAKASSAAKSFPNRRAEGGKQPCQGSLTLKPGRNPG